VFLDPQNAPKSLAAGASPQTQLCELIALPPDPLAGLRGLTSKGRGGEGEGILLRNSFRGLVTPLTFVDFWLCSAYLLQSLCHNIRPIDTLVFFVYRYIDILRYYSLLL